MEVIRSYINALLEKMGFHINRHRHEETVLENEEPLQSERRRESRRPRISPCTYGVKRSADRGSFIEEGYGTAVNDSLTGMRLLLGVAPSKGQLLEIQTDDRTLEHPICLVEVCWTKPLRENAQEDAHEELYLVGCRQSIGGNHDETHIAATRMPRGTDL
ncbi:MAG TPA: hypothetical protein VIW47_00405 [Nitrospiraceae bacterium]